MTLLSTVDRQFCCAPSSMACRMARARRLSARRLMYQAMKVATDTTSRIRLATALISGFTPSLTAEKISIGKVLWQEFFNNRDWPVASALAVVMLVILLVPIILFNRNQTKELEGKL